MLCTSSPLKSDDEFLNGLQEGLGSLQLVDDALHVRLVQRVAVEKGGPLEIISFSPLFHGLHFPSYLVGCDSESRLGGNLHDL